MLLIRVTDLQVTTHSLHEWCKLLRVPYMNGTNVSTIDVTNMHVSVSY
jgi:hypothetical protein